MRCGLWSRQAGFRSGGEATSCGEAAGASLSNRTNPDRRRQTGRLRVRDAARNGTKVETGRRQTESGSMLNPRACDTMTGAVAGLSMRHSECKQQANLSSLSAPGPRPRDRTGRNKSANKLQHLLHTWSIRLSTNSGTRPTPALTKCPKRTYFPQRRSSTSNPIHPATILRYLTLAHRT